MDTVDPVTMAGALVGFARALNVRLRETPEGGDLTLAELNVLTGIDMGYDLASTLVRKLLLDAPRVSRIVDGFVASGYIMRGPDLDDRRRNRLRLTQSGKARLSRGRGRLGMAMEELLAELTCEERDGLERAVPGMQRILTRDAAPDSDIANSYNRS